MDLLFELFAIERVVIEDFMEIWDRLDSFCLKALGIVPESIDLSAGSAFSTVKSWAFKASFVREADIIFTSFGSEDLDGGWFAEEGFLVFNFF